jgi:hypothetical protein
MVRKAKIVEKAKWRNLVSEKTSCRQLGEEGVVD